MEIDFMKKAMTATKFRVVVYYPSNKKYNK